MEKDTIDFEGMNETTSVENTDQNDNTKNSNPANQPDTTHLDGTDVEDINAKNDVQNDDKKESDNNSNTLEEGTIINIDGVDHTVDKDGNIVDDKGNIFKEAKDVEGWLKENESKEDNDTDISIDNIRKDIDLEVLDAEGNPIEFENTREGVSSYINAIIDYKTEEIKEATLNSFLTDHPYVADIIDYYQIYGTTQGFGQLEDRTNIQLDPENEQQQINVLLIAAKEFGNTTINENYIKYLKSTGALYDEAKNQLDNLKQKDIKAKEQRQQEAAKARKEQAAAQQAYFDTVYNKIKARKFGDIVLPETIIRTKDGRKTTATLDDFYDYVSNYKYKTQDGRVLTKYLLDKANESEDDMINNQIINAWLTYTGNNYKDLINMLVKEENVRRLVVKSKENKAKHQVKVSKPSNKAKGSIDDILF